MTLLIYMIGAFALPMCIKEWADILTDKDLR